jgi:SAM-dependent methyltransferase
VVDGIPILLPDEVERRRTGEQDWLRHPDVPGPLTFYNSPAEQDKFCRDRMDAIRDEVVSWFRQAPAEGPTLEIGSGKGPLQGIGEDHVALDYSLTALQRYIEPAHQRVCGTADALPFPDGTFGFVYSVTTLEHVRLVGRAFEEIDRVLRPGGLAYLAPAWHCMQDHCEGTLVRPYRDLTPRQKLMKLTFPLRSSILYKGAVTFPGRVLRRGVWHLAGGRPTRLRYNNLRPDYSHFWIADSDAVSRVDSHEGALFFHSRGYEVLRPGGAAIRQLLARHHAVVVRKPARPAGAAGSVTTGALTAQPGREAVSH